VGEGVLAAARLAVLQDAPLIVFTASGGARMQEGAISLMQMPRSVIATRLVKEAGLPYIVVLTDPTTGGVTASFPMLGDIQIAEPGALIGFAGAVGALGGVFINVALRLSYVGAAKSATNAFWVFLAFYVVCAIVTWFVFLRMKSVKAITGEHVGRTPQAVGAS
jgi:nitrate/nitrite transporter NarK